MGRPARATIGDDRLDALLHALADRTRRALLERLARGPAMITELAEPFDMSLPAVSKHIRVLEEAGLLERSIDGRVHVCALRPEPLNELEEWARSQRVFWDERLERLARFAEQKR
jgi:DNA-binding transcriptional ArsR family regulator